MVAVTTEILINNNNNKVSQSCPTLWDPTDSSLSGSSIHGIFSGKNTGVGCHFLLQEIFPTWGLNPGLPHCRQMLYHLRHQGSSDFGTHENSLLLFPLFSLSTCHEVIAPDAMILVFSMLSFNPAFLLSSFTFTKRLLSSS